MSTRIDKLVQEQLAKPDDALDGDGFTLVEDEPIFSALLAEHRDPFVPLGGMKVAIREAGTWQPGPDDPDPREESTGGGRMDAEEPEVHGAGVPAGTGTGRGHDQEGGAVHVGAGDPPAGKAPRKRRGSADKAPR